MPLLQKQASNLPVKLPSVYLKRVLMNASSPISESLIELLLHSAIVHIHISTLTFGAVCMEFLL